MTEFELFKYGKPAYAGLNVVRKVTHYICRKSDSGLIATLSFNDEGEKFYSFHETGLTESQLAEVTSLFDKVEAP